jgi:hypothetical protein
LLTIDGATSCRGLLIHYESDEMKQFHLHLVPGLEQSPTDPLHLVLLSRDTARVGKVCIAAVELIG